MFPWPVVQVIWVGYDPLKSITAAQRVGIEAWEIITLNLIKRRCIKRSLSCALHAFVKRPLATCLAVSLCFLYLRQNIFLHIFSFLASMLYFNVENYFVELSGWLLWNWAGLMTFSQSCLKIKLNLIIYTSAFNHT